MRQRLVNEKAVSKLIAFLKAVKQKIDSEFEPDIAIMQSEFMVSKSTYSVMKKLKIVAFDELAIKAMDNTVNWIDKREPCREMALQILEYLRLKSDKQSDQPISDLWVVEIASIRNLLTEIRDNAKKKDKGLNALISSPERDRFETARMFASSIVSNREAGSIGPESIDLINQTAISLTDDLLKKLNQ